MATKKPSAAQLRARKLFAERARSGAFGKPAAKRRKKNPASGKDHDIGAAEWDDSGERDRNPIGRSAHSRGGSPSALGRSGHSRGGSPSALGRSRSGPTSKWDDHGEVAVNKPRKLNPAHAAPTRFAIHLADPYTGRPRGAALAYAPTLPLAKEIAQALCDKRDKATIIVGKR